MINEKTLQLIEYRKKHHKTTKTDEMKKVLVIDDEPEMLNALAMRIHAAEYEVSVADSGSLGLYKAQKIRPDLIILDVLLPGMDGFQISTRLKSYPETQGIPVLYLSCLLNDWDEQNMVPGKDRDLCLGKPFNPEKLLSTIDLLLKGG